jgi:hypothetical protein
MSRDLRWQTMVDKMRIGLAQEQPAKVLCDGLSAADEKKIRQDFADRDTAYVDDLIDGLNTQDGGRIMLMRAGVSLVLENPRGQDGSRISYQKLMAQKCGHPPRLGFAHLHQSWMDLSLALGWLGAALFAGVLYSFARAGMGAITRPAIAPWALALTVISVFWFMRGFADSLYREHYLQMQALLMAYLLGRMRIDESRRTPV